MASAKPIRKNARKIGNVLSHIGEPLGSWAKIPLDRVYHGRRPFTAFRGRLVSFPKAFEKRAACLYGENRPLKSRCCPCPDRGQHLGWCMKDANSDAATFC